MLVTLAREFAPLPARLTSHSAYAAYLPPAPFEAAQKGEFWVTPAPTHASATQQQEWLQENSYSTP